MPTIELKLDGDIAWRDISLDKIIVAPDETIKMACVKDGIKIGKSSIAFLIKQPDGNYLLTQTSLSSFAACARTILEEFEDELNEY